MVHQSFLWSSAEESFGRAGQMRPLEQDLSEEHFSRDAQAGGVHWEQLEEAQCTVNRNYHETIEATEFDPSLFS